jgi:exodeoxyribonuclease V beta subunit
MIAHYPRPPILADIPRDRHAVIEASAGTGKTFTIEHMVVDLLLREGAPLSEILALTFTERAAVELRSRIRSKIEEILVCSDEPGKHRGQRPGDVWRIDDDARDRLSRALFAFDSASIGTIHGFFGRVLTEHAFTNGRLFVGELEDGRALFDRAFKTALRRSLARRPGDAAELLAYWMEQTRDGIDGLENLLWKCHSSRRRILPSFDIESIKGEIAKSPLFAIDLSGEAERFRLALKTAKVHGRSIDSILNRLTVISGLIDRAGRSVGTLLDDKFREAVRFIGERIPERGLGEPLAAEIAKAILHMQAILVSLKAAIVQTSLPIVCEVLDRHKAATGQFDYDDLITGVAHALDGPRGEELIRAMRARYRFALIDEFQDTDELQWFFFENVFVKSGGRNLAYLIGDPKQAIYGFRGADVFTYIKARDQVEHDGSPRVPLTHNFRSTSDLIKAYNHILDPSATPPFFDGDIQYDKLVEAGRELVIEEADGSTAVPIHLLKIEPKNAEAKLSMNELRRGLARQIAREVGSVLSEKQGLRFGAKGQAQRVAPGEVFILAATNKDAREVSRAVREAGVPFSFYKQDGLFQTDEARDVRDLLAAIDNPGDSGRRGRAWITPFFAVPLTALPDLADLPDSHPLVKRLADWKDLADRRRFETLFARILDDSGVIRRELFLKDDERALTNYLHLFEVLLEDARAAGCTLADLVTTLNAYILETRKPPGEDGNVQRLESDREAVQIMTIHKSKGLEAAVVFVYGGFGGGRSDGLHRYHKDQQRVLYIGDDEHAKSAAKEEREREEQRIYYVALTRAKARLYLPMVPAEFWNNRWDGGYGRVNKRLLAVESGLTGTANEHLFKVIPFRDRWIGDGADDPADPSRDLASWEPPRALLEDRPHSWDFHRLRGRHAGYEVSSYSRMKRAWSEEIDPLERAEFRRDPGRATLAVAPPEGELPGGTASGSMLHEILEFIPFESLIQSPIFDEWRQRKEIADIVTSAMNRNGIDMKYRREAETLVYNALTVDVPLDQAPSIPGLCHCQSHLREMEFLFPFPEDSHPPLSALKPGKLVIERGFIKGFVDLVVQHKDRVYFADWKSDFLPSYEQETIVKHVDDHYELQAKLYSLAMVKALGINSEAVYERSFGGLFYVFLRSLRGENASKPGVYFKKPSWAEILDYEDEVKRFDARSRGGRP